MLVYKKFNSYCAHQKWNLSLLQLEPFFYEGPYRFVTPYPYEFRARVRGAWVNRPLFDVCLEQFCGPRSSVDSDELRKRIESGSISVFTEGEDSAKSVTHGYILTLKDTIISKVLRIENGVLNIPPVLIHEDSNIVAFCKPPTLPLITTGPYRFNTMYRYLIDHYPDLNSQQLFLTHRIDGVTSGCVVYAKTKKVAKSIAEAHLNNTISKLYIARVRGLFDDSQLFNAITVSDPLKQDPSHSGIRVIASPDGKTSRTLVYPLVTNLHKLRTDSLLDHNFSFFKSEMDPRAVSDELGDSIVACLLQTGRKHQIRVHLKSLGFPIVGDVLYGNEEDSCSSDLTNVSAPPICLHSFKYEMTGLFTVNSPLPFWCADGALVINRLYFEDVDSLQ
ncbi:hypothetical protein GEMRC1_004272 [Eukaryota sp. GEM-RC1]